MTRKTIVLGAALVLLALAGSRMTRKSSPPPPASQPTAAAEAPPAPGAFPAPEDARRFAVARLWAAQGVHAAGDPYSSTFTRHFTPLVGATIPYYLLEEPARELSLAEGFFRHGFVREALAHADALITFHPDSVEAARAKARLDTFRRATVLGLVGPLPLLVEDELGDRFVLAPAPREAAFDLDRVQDAFLGSTMTLPNHLQVVGFVDDAGQVVIHPRNPKRLVYEAEPSDFTGRSEGSLAEGRVFYRIGKATTLFEAEAGKKKVLLKELAERVDASELEGRARFRRIADAMLYAGFPEDAAMLLAQIEEPPPADESSPAHRLDAVWRNAVDDHPRFTLSTASSVTTGAELPIDLDAHALRELTFRFARFEGPLPVQEKDVQGWLSTVKTAPAHVEKLAVAEGKSVLRLPVREVGAYRVTAEGRGLSCSFLVIRTDAAIDLLAFPGETLFSAGREGFTVSNSIKVLGTTEADGLFSFQGGVLGKFCDAHRQCCSSCESCLHHHSDEAVLNSGARVFVSGHGQFFRASAKIDTAEVTRMHPAPPAPILLVTTDRPAYKAGDTMRFRGILRIPRQPLKRSDTIRLDPAPEREVSLAIRCGDSAVFQRTYVTGDFGTFNGQFTLPLTAARAEYSIEIAYADAKVAQLFQVLDYRKTDYSIVLTPDPRGLRVEAGYVWGGPVADAVLVCTVDGAMATPEAGLLAMSPGQKAVVSLLRGGETLATKSQRLRPRPEAPPAPAAAPAPVAPTTKPAAPATESKVEPPAFTLTPSKDLYGRDELIEVTLAGPWKEAEATVVVGDSQLYSLARVPVRDGRGVARFPVRPIFDPGVTVFALCNGLQARADVQVRTRQMAVSIEAPAKARPGEKVDVLLRADPKAEFSLAAVDEAIYMIAEDDTPDLYTHFFTPRPSAIAWGRCEKFDYDGESFKRENPLEGPNFRSGPEVLARLSRRAGFRRDGEIGFGWEGERYGGRFGGRMNLVARGGGTRVTESAVLAGFRGLAPLQQPDGSWASTSVTAAGTISDTGSTALVLLSYLGAGYSQLSKDEYPDPTRPGQIHRMGEIVKRGLQWLLQNQGPTGVIASPGGDAHLNHALATLALSEAYGMTASVPLKDPAQKAVDALCAMASREGGWHRNDPGSRGEILASTFGVMALTSARMSELSFPAATAENAWTFFNQEVDDDGLCGNPPTRAQVGGAMLAHIFLRKDKFDPRIMGAAGWLVANKPAWVQADPLGWYLGGLALFRYDGPDGPCWKTWNEHLKDILVRNQAKSGLWTLGNESIVATALSSLTLEVYYRYANVFGGSGGGQGAPPLAPAPKLRVYFPDTAFWAPDLVTDEKGEARVSLTLPDQITTTRLTARGITKESAVGQATGRIAARLPFFVKICAPEFVVLGDEVEVRVEAHNHTASAMEAILVLEGAGESKKTRVPTDRPGSATWRVRAGDPAGLRLVAHGRSGDREDAMERVIPVRRQGREGFAGSHLKAEAGEVRRFDAAPNAESVVVRIHPQRGTLSQLLDALRYLNEYPYGCTEQTLAKVVPNVMTADMLRRLKIPAEQFNAQFEPMMRAGKDRLLSRQRASGGWGWFDNDEEDPFMTALSVYGLAECERLGYPLDSVALKRGRDRLRQMAAVEDNLDRLAFEAYVLGEEFDRLLPVSEKLSSFAHSLLILTLVKANRPEKEALAKAHVLRAVGDHWETAHWFYKWDDVSIETTAYSIQALAAVSPNHPLIAKATAWLLAQRQGNRWRSTKDTAVAIATLLKIGDVESTAGAVKVDAAPVERPAMLRSVAVVLNGGERHELRLDLNNPLKGVFEAHFTRLNPGPNILSFEKLDESSDFKFDVDVSQRTWAERIDSQSRGVSVTVSYDKPLDGLRVGDEVTATAIVSAAQPSDYLMVQSPIPAGCEVIRGSGTGGFAGFEERYDKAIFFLRSLDGEPMQLQYKMRCSFAGRFLVLPPWAGLMYNEDLYGTGEARSASILP